MLFVTPEYNRSMPGCLKNAVDVASRPYGQSVLDGRPAAVVSVTPHQLGAFGANHALRQTFVFLNVPVMQQPEAYIANAGELFDDKGNLTKDSTRGFLKQFMAAFEKWIAQISAQRPAGATPDTKRDSGDRASRSESPSQSGAATGGSQRPASPSSRH